MRNEVKQKNSLIRNLENSIQTLQAIRRSMLEVGAKDRELKWAVGGMYIVLVNGLLTTIGDTLANREECYNPNAQDDLREILKGFTQFIENNLTGE